MKRLLQTLTVLAAITASSAGAQAITAWGTVQGGYAPLRGTFSVGLGTELPLGVAVVGVEITPFGRTLEGLNVYGAALVVRDVPVPFSAISLRGELGLEQYSAGGPFDGSPFAVYAGGGVRYAFAAPLPIGLTGGARLYLNGPSAFSVTIGLDVRL